METRIDIHLTRSDTGQLTPVENLTVGHLGRSASNEDNNLSLLSPDLHSNVVTDRSDVAQEGQSPIRPSKDQEPSDIQTEPKSIDHGHSHACPQGNSDQVGLLATPKKVARQMVELPVPERTSSVEFPSEWVVDPAGGPTSSVNLNDTPAPAVVCCQESPMLRAMIVSPATPPGAEREAEPGNLPLDHVETSGLTCLTDEGKTREDIDEDVLHSLPPSSSPPQLFSSSPYASSQSSIGDVEPLKTVLTAELDICASPCGYVHDDNVVPVTQNDPRLGSEDNHNHDIAEVATSPETDKHSSRMGPISSIEDDPELSRKRFADRDELYGSQPTKRLNLDPRPCLPPAPKRATMAAQCRQFKKLATPFRTPLKFPVAAAGLAMTINDNGIELTVNATREAGRDEANRKGPTISSRHKSTNKPRSVTQFKSPLVNGTISSDSRTIRLTPALQTLERKLQLLKRAIKVKENNEEETLIRLAEKWTEAGREVAYGIWEAVKDTNDFMGKAMFVRRSHGWESTNSGNTLWAWDNKPRDPDEESRGLDSSEVPYVAGPLVSEEGDEAGCNTLGTMLRQLGVVPEIFGWDDKKEAFCD